MPTTFILAPLVALCGLGEGGRALKKGRRPMPEFQGALTLQVNLTEPRGSGPSAPAEGRAPEPSLLLGEQVDTWIHTSYFPTWKCP